MKRRRNSKSIYYDRETKTVNKATCFPSYPACRKRRYLFIGYFFYVPSMTNKRVVAFLKQNNIRIKKDKNLPF